MNDGLDEIESFEDLDDGEGFQFYGVPSKKDGNKAKPAQKQGPLSPALGLGLDKVQPLGNLGIGSGN